MRNLQTTISTIVRQGVQLIVRGEVLRSLGLSLGANSLDALAVMCGKKPAFCYATAKYATVKQTTRRHDIACRHASA